MNKDDRYVIQTVAEDLRFLRQECDDSVSDESLRRSSGPLRRLLVEDAYGRAWRLVGFSGEPQVEAPDLMRNLAGFDEARVTYAQAGGATSRGMKIAQVLEVDFVMSPEQIAERFRRGPEPALSQFGLARFLASVCVIHRGVNITRRGLIQYVANKLGGVHLDTRRDPSGDREAIALDEVIAYRMVGDRPAVYFEVLSVGQSLIASADLKAFAERAESLFTQGG